MALLEVAGISKLEKENFTVKEISFTQQFLQKIAIAGETGSGKTTLLKMIAGLIQPDTGNIIFDGKRVLGPLEKLIPGHPDIAYLSQHFELRNNYRVEEELESKNLLTDEEASAIYAVCRIQHLLKRKTDQLSGGERQRIVLARLLTTSPKLLVLDEPFSNLDAVHKNIIKSVLEDLGTKLNITCILVSHDAMDSLSWAATIIVMKEGQIIQYGTPEQIYNQPVNEYCAGLFGEYNLISKPNAAALLNKDEVVPGKKKLLIRPENFNIVSKNDSTIKGIVGNILFFGSYYTIDVLIGKQLIRIKSANNQFVKGDTVYLSLAPEKIWYV
jgi:ABC-type Fe3+/spermidine/putrescine transport system ATPase subunit